MADVFLSYKRQDRGAIEQIATALRALKLEIWFDASLTAGESFSDEIDREAKTAKAIVVCWSPASAESKWVKAEALIGFEKENLAAIHVAGPDGFSPPAPFNSLHIEDLRAWVTSPDSSMPAWRSVLRRIASIDGALFHRIATRNAARPYRVNGGKRLTLRELVLLAITKANINQKIGITRVSLNIARILDAQAPDRREIADAVTDLIGEMRKAGQSGLVVDNNRFLYIAHPFFKSYLVWILAPYSGADLPHLERYVEPADNDSDGVEV